MRNVSWLKTLTTLAIMVLASAATGAIPEVITYQGELSDGGGNPVDGVHSATISVYDVLEGGSPLWQETQNVTFSNGLFTIQLGADLLNPFGLDFSQQYWLGISIDADPELSPRTPLTSSPYAFRAKYLDELSYENIQQFFAIAASLPDADGDGYNKISLGGDDCDDLNPNVYPGAPEYCDGIDNDCNGFIDDNTVDCTEGLVCFQLQCVQPDNDGDGWGADQDCDDSDPNVYPGAPEICDGVDNDCDGVVDDVDNDGDGFSACLDDCDDANPSVYPGAPEICGDNIDNNCDGVIDEGCVFDNDGDGWNSDQDCDDNDPSIYPGAPEYCNGIDDDCDGQIDNNVVDCPPGSFCSNGVCYYLDGDGDGWDAGQDCDDSDPNVYPGAPEYCNGIDDDCDGQIDNNVIDCPSGSVCVNGVCVFLDNDGDGWNSDQDCDDNDPSIYPGAPEFCDGVDRNCNGIIYEDMDFDGYPCNIDCDDTNPSVYPGAPEICGDFIDNNCDGQVDEGCP